MFLFILFITYAFHYLFVKTDRAMPALARRRWQSCTRAAVPRTQPRQHGRGQDPESGLCGGRGGRRAQAGPAAQAPCPASLPKGKALLLCLPCCHGLLLCSMPRASPMGTNQPLYATSRRSDPAPAPEQAPRTAFRSGARPTPPLPTSGRELSQPHHPVPVPNTSGLSPAPAGPHSRTPTPSSCAVFLPAPSSSRCLGACHGHGLSGDVPVMVLAAMAR